MSADDFQGEARAHRLEKLEKLRQRGVEPYPVRFDRDATAAALREEFGDLAAGSETGKQVKLAGRILGERRHGGLDLGDWVGVEGTVIVSNKGELTVRVDRFELLSKSLRALPDVRHGVADPETRYRQRYLDLTLDEDSRRVFRIRSAVIASIKSRTRSVVS